MSSKKSTLCPINVLIEIQHRYLPVRREIVEKIHREDVFNNGPFQWRPEIYDCDDFGVGMSASRLYIKKGLGFIV